MRDHFKRPANTEITQDWLDMDLSANSGLKTALAEDDNGGFSVALRYITNNK
jgi:hypothetical protein